LNSHDCKWVQPQLQRHFTSDLSTARPKWRLDGPGLSDRSLYLPASPAFAKIYQHYIVWLVIIIILMKQHVFNIIIRCKQAICKIGRPWIGGGAIWRYGFSTIYAYLSSIYRVIVNTFYRSLIWKWFQVSLSHVSVWQFHNMALRRHLKEEHTDCGHVICRAKYRKTYLVHTAVHHSFWRVFPLQSSWGGRHLVFYEII